MSIKLFFHTFTTMKLSIIVPIYNVEKTLKRCVDSILRQRLDNYELLLIDDGSPDNSGAMADKMADNNRIKVYHKANGGLSDARNYGLDRATGDYITFVDSDDEIAQNTFPKLLEILHEHPEYDILEYSVKQIKKNKNVLFDPGEHVYQNATDWLKNKGLQHCWMCNKIFKRKLFENTRFSTDIIRFEDMRLMSEVLIKNLTIATTSHGMYLYYENENGLVATTPSYSGLLKEQINLINKVGIDTRKAEWHHLYMDMFNIQLYVYMQTGDILLPRQWVRPRIYNDIQGLIKSLALDVFGLRMSCKLFKLLMKRR